MKINVYARDLTHDLDIEERTAENGKNYLGLHFNLRRRYAQDSLTRSRETAPSITLWSTASPEGSGEINAGELANILEEGVKLLRAKQPKSRRPARRRA